MQNIIVILLVMMLSFNSTVIFAVTTNDLNNNISQQEQKKQESKQLQSDIDETLGTVQSLQDKIEVSNDQIDSLNEQISKYDIEIEKQLRALELANTKYEGQDELLKARLRTIYENGTVNFWDVLFSSKSIGEFLSKYDVIIKMVEYDKQILSSINNQKEYVNNIKTQIENEQKAKEAVKQNQENEKKKLESNKIAQESAMKKLQTNKAAVDKIIADMEAEEAKIRAALAAMGRSIYVGGTFTWPVPNYYRVSSPYGDRTHPIYGYTKAHAGIDIAGSGIGGKPTVAANKGRVFLANYGWNGGYGNYIIIDHGGGYTTRYAHLSSISVSVGQQVAKGQTIGTVGTTGNSTGNHLHFEIRINNNPQNPMNHYTKVGG